MLPSGIAFILAAIVCVFVSFQVFSYLALNRERYWAIFAVSLLFGFFVPMDGNSVGWKIVSITSGISIACLLKILRSRQVNS